jgi:general secretion pathway protein I
MLKNRRRNTAAFTLLEVLVAFVILGLASGALMTAFGGGIVKITRAENERLAALAARSVLALAGSEIPLEPGAHEGNLPGNIHWTISIAPYEKSAVDPFADPGTPAFVTTLYRVTVLTMVGAASNRVQASIETLRLKAEGPS